MRLTSCHARPRAAPACAPRSASSRSPSAASSASRSARVVEDPVERRGHLAFGRAQRRRRRLRQREPDRSPVARDRLARRRSPRSTRPSTTAVIVGLATASRSASRRRPLVARGDQGEHPVLGQRQVAAAARSSERAARARARAARGEVGVGHRSREGYRTVRGPNYPHGRGPTRRHEACGGGMMHVTGARDRCRDDQREGGARRRRRARSSAGRQRPLVDRARDGDARRAGRRGDVAAPRATRSAEVTSAHRATVGVARSASAASTRRSCPSTTTARPVAPMLMWQDQRGTDHSFEIMSRDENAFMTSSNATASRRSAAASRSATSCTTNSTGPTCTRAPRRTSRRWTTSPRADRPHHRDQHIAFMVPAVRQPHARRDAVRRRPRQARAASTRRACRRLVAGRRRDRHAAAGRRRPSSGCPRSTTVYARHERHRHGRGRDRRVHARAEPGSRSARPACSSTRSPTSASTSSTRSCRCRARTPTATSCARRTGSAARCSSTCCATSCTPTDELGDHRVDDPFAALDAVLARDRARRGRRACSSRGSTARSRRSGSGTIRGGFVHMSLETNRRDLVRAVVEGIAHNLGWLLPHVEAFTGERDRRDRVRRRRGALGAVVPGPRRRARPAGLAARRPRPRRRRARWRCSRSSGTA